MIKKSLIKCMTLIAICSLLFAGCGKKSKTTIVEASRENSTVTEKETKPSVAGMEVTVQVTDSFGNSVDVAGELVTNASGEKRVVITDRDGNKTEIPATGFSENGNTVTITDSTVAGEISSAAADNKIPGADEVAAVVPSDKKEEGGNGSNSGGDSSGNSGNSGSDNGNSGSDGGNSGSNSGGSSSGSSSQTPSAPTHVHSWEAVYTTVHHDAVTHEEQRWVVDKEAWEEPVKTCHYICRHCKDGTCKRCAALGITQYEYNTIEELHVHMVGCVDPEDGSKNGSCFSSSSVEVIDHYVHHDAEGHYETVTVTDSGAYDEQVVAGYKCSCGAVK